MRLESAVPGTYSKREPRTLNGADASVPAALAVTLSLLAVPFSYLLATLADRAVHHWLGGPGTVAETRWLIAGVVGMGVAVVFLVLWMLDDRRLYTVEEGKTHVEPVVQQAIDWQMPMGPHQLARGRLVADPAVVVEWAKWAVTGQSVSYATWGQKFGGDRAYARFLKALVDSGLGMKGSGGEFFLTSKGLALFKQAVMGTDPTALLGGFPLLQGETTGEIR